jgi:hypothetical protein
MSAPNRLPAPWNFRWPVDVSYSPERPAQPTFHPIRTLITRKPGGPVGAIGFDISFKPSKPDRSRIRSNSECHHSAPRRSPTLRHRPCRSRSARLAQEAEGVALVVLGLACSTGNAVAATFQGLGFDYSEAVGVRATVL